MLPYHARMYLSLSAVSLEGMSPYEERYGDTFKKQNFPKALLEKIVRTVFSKYQFLGSIYAAWHCLIYSVLKSIL